MIVRITVITDFSFLKIKRFFVMASSTVTLIIILIICANNISALWHCDGDRSLAPGKVKHSHLRSVLILFMHVCVLGQRHIDYRLYTWLLHLELV